MDEFLRTRFRVVGIVTIIIFIVFFIVLLFAQNKEKKNTSLKLKVFYSELVQAVSISRINHGHLSDWGWVSGVTNTELIKEKLFNGFVVDKYCFGDNSGCFANNSYKSLKLKDTNLNLYKLPAIKLNNGVSIAVNPLSNCQKIGSVCALLYVDLNNTEAPNAFGKDLFVFSVINSDNIPVVPYNIFNDIDVIKNDKSFGCNKDAQLAMSCAAYISLNNWRIDSSYPW